jgi:transposase
MLPGVATPPMPLSGAGGSNPAQRPVRAAIHETALNETIRALGWHVSATNADVARLALEQAVLADRPAYWVEHGFRRVQGHARSLPPTDRPRANHRTGLIRRLTIGLRLLSLLECVVRRQLVQEPSTLTGLDAGNPKRTTGRPTAEPLLTALGNLPLTISGEGAQLRHHLTPRSTLQQRIVLLLGLSSLIYTNLAFDSS